MFDALFKAFGSHKSVARRRLQSRLQAVAPSTTLAPKVSSKASTLKVCNILQHKTTRFASDQSRGRALSAMLPIRITSCFNCIQLMRTGILGPVLVRLGRVDAHLQAKVTRTALLTGCSFLGQGEIWQSLARVPIDFAVVSWTVTVIKRSLFLSTLKSLLKSFGCN